MRLLPRRVSHIPLVPAALLALGVGIGVPGEARAVLDIEDRGPLLEAGRFRMRVTNAGILGNAFFDSGLSYDPSFEFPGGSGVELLNHAELWVGGVDASGRVRVSGGPMLEWRPTLDPEDRVRVAWRDQLGARRMVDDDRDGRVDEELLNGRDDDGDGEVDEDLGISSQQMTAATYVDDRPEAVGFIGSSAEPHVPLGLSVRQEAYAWAFPGYEGIAGLWFQITNHGTQTLRDLYVGLLADLDVRQRQDRSGHLDDRIATIQYSRAVPLGTQVITGASQPRSYNCVARLQQTLPALIDGDRPDLPAVALVGLDHTVDPYAFIDPARAFARAPGKTSFRYRVFSHSAAPGTGGIPILDVDRYGALAGRDSGAVPEGRADWAVLVSCGPFPSLGPGQSIEFAAALVGAATLDSLRLAVGDAAVLQFGSYANLLPDSTVGDTPTDYTEGISGRNGHEVCVEPPAGGGFDWDPHCPIVLGGGDVDPPIGVPVHYEPGHCVWTDADCDKCTGVGGRETAVRWLDPGDVPPAPGFRVTPLDHAIRVEWDNRPEVLLKGGQIGNRDSRFLGYRLYRIDDWRERASLLPPPDAWALVGAFADSTANGERLLASVTDTTLDYQRVLFEQKLYPVGRYTVTDSTPKNGFKYVYAVTSVYDPALRRADGSVVHRRLESPLVVHFEDVVSPHSAARSRAGGVWVVPNPFRGGAEWDLPPVDGDRLTRHLDFMGMPRARAVVRVYTLAGDLVQTFEHDGSQGNGELSWDLVSRNGQDIVSGIYLFTVDSALGHQVGRFVVIR